MLKSLLTAASVAGLAFLANAPGSAQAQSAPNPDQVSVRVHYADLNLSSQAGARDMIGRIDSAARTICGGPSSNADLSGWAQQKMCVDGTVADAVQKLGNPTVTALLEQHFDSSTFLANR